MEAPGPASGLNGSPPVLFEVLRILTFANGSAVSMPMKIVSTEEDARAHVQTLSEQWKARASADAPLTRACAELGIVGCSFGAKPVFGPDSRIIAAPAGLVVPRSFG